MIFFAVHFNHLASRAGRAHIPHDPVPATRPAAAPVPRHRGALVPRPLRYRWPARYRQRVPVPPGAVPPPRPPGAAAAPRTARRQAAGRRWLGAEAPAETRPSAALSPSLPPPPPSPPRHRSAPAERGPGPGSAEKGNEELREPSVFQRHLCTRWYKSWTASSWNPFLNTWRTRE